MVATPTQTNFLYRFEAGSAAYTFTNITESVPYDGESYEPLEIQHSAPTYSGEPQDGEITVETTEVNALADLFILGPPAYPIILVIYEYDRVTGTATPYYKGWVVRTPFNLIKSTMQFRLKTLWHFFERESFTDSLSALSRYSIFDPRSGVDIEAYRTSIAVTDFNDERDELTVTGITQPDDWFKGGLIIAPDRDMRTILTHQTVGADVILTLNAAFPRFTLDTGFTADIYPGDDLTYATWSVKFDTETNNGEAFGGWPYMPNVDPAVRGVI